MPIGTSDMDPRDRMVILVASRIGLIKLACHASLNQAVISRRLVRAASSLFDAKAPLPIILTSVWSTIKEREYTNRSTAEILSAVDEALELGVSPVLFDPSDAVHMFNFGVGNTPTDGTFYVQHPVIFNAYINPADFSRTVSKEKEAAFRQLASSLGAKTLTLINANVVTNKRLFGATVSILKAAADTGIKVEVDKKGLLVKKVYSEYGHPRRAPYVPPDLQPWVDMDADLRTMVRDRIEGHLLRNTITLEFKEGIGIGGDVAAKLANRGFTATHYYEAICRSVWYFDVEYYSLNS